MQQTSGGGHDCGDESQHGEGAPAACGERDEGERDGANTGEQAGEGRDEGIRRYWLLVVVWCLVLGMLMLGQVLAAKEAS